MAEICHKSGMVMERERGLANRWFQPLTHVSGGGFPRVSATLRQRGKRETREGQRFAVSQSMAHSVPVLPLGRAGGDVMDRLLPCRAARDAEAETSLPESGTLVPDMPGAGRVSAFDVAALFVETGGCYFGLPGVDPWDEPRDARKYGGPHPVVAHPPCQRWGNFWFGGTHKGSRRYRLGDDEGCFAAALAAVRQWGGIIEHPKRSRAWAHFNLNPPPRDGGWIAADFIGGWTCCVDQSAYGHKARKATWLYAFGVELPELRWGAADGDFAWLRAPSAQRMRERGMIAPPAVVPRRECEATPIPFRDLLISIARTAEAERAAA